MNYEIYRKKHYVSNGNISAKASMYINQIRKIINIYLRMRSKNISCTVLSSDCLGGGLFSMIWEKNSIARQ